MEDYKFLFKVVLIGNSGVGKTCLVRRFTQGVFPKGQGATIGVDFMIKTLEIENSAGQREAVKLQIWDTGKEFIYSAAKRTNSRLFSFEQPARNDSGQSLSHTTEAPMP